MNHASAKQELVFVPIIRYLPFKSHHLAATLFRNCQSKNKPKEWCFQFSPPAYRTRTIVIDFNVSSVEQDTGTAVLLIAQYMYVCMLPHNCVSFSSVFCTLTPYFAIVPAHVVHLFFHLASLMCNLLSNFIQQQMQQS